MVKISVIAAVYNTEKYLHQFLDSVRKQSLRDFEIVLVDDGSKDDCPRILDEFAEEDPRYKVIHKKNGGVSSARNAGLEQVSGEYVYIVDSDDWLDPTALESLWTEAEKTQADVVYGVTITEKGAESSIYRAFPQPFFSARKETINEIQCALSCNFLIKTDCSELPYISYLGGAPWRAMFRRSIVEQNGIRYNEGLRTLGEDILFWQNIYEHVRSVAYIKEPVYHYRRTEQSLSHGYKPNQLEIYREVFPAQEEFLKTHGKGPEHWNAYYFRVILYVFQAMDYYFQNPENPKSDFERFTEFKATLASEPYKTAFASVPVEKLLSKKDRLKILMLRYGLLRLFWELKKRR